MLSQPVFADIVLPFSDATVQMIYIASGVALALYYIPQIRSMWWFRNDLRSHSLSTYLAQFACHAVSWLFGALVLHSLPFLIVISLELVARLTIIGITVIGERDSAPLDSAVAAARNIGRRDIKQGTHLDRLHQSLEGLYRSRTSDPHEAMRRDADPIASLKRAEERLEQAHAEYQQARGFVALRVALTSLG